MELLRDSLSLIRDQAESIESEMDYIRLTNDFYNRFWQSSPEAEESYEEIWQHVSYVYTADLSEEGMIDLLRTRSGILTVTAYSRTHWGRIRELDAAINSTADMKQKYSLLKKIRMYSINVPITRRVRLTHESGPENGTGRDYLVVEANYDPVLGLLFDL
jgi:hypothetical protein